MLNPLYPITTCALLTPWTRATRVLNPLYPITTCALLTPWTRATRVLNPLCPITTCALLTPWTRATRDTYCFAQKLMPFVPQKTLVKLYQCFSNFMQDTEKSLTCTVPKRFVWIYKCSDESRRYIWIVLGYKMLLAGRHMTSAWYEISLTWGRMS